MSSSAMQRPLCPVPWDLCSAGSKAKEAMEASLLLSHLYMKICWQTKHTEQVTQNTTHYNASIGHRDTYSPNEHVVGNVIQMSTVFQPRPSWTDVVCRTFSLNLSTISYILISSLHINQYAKPSSKVKMIYTSANCQVLCNVVKELPRKQKAHNYFKSP